MGLEGKENGEITNGEGEGKLEWGKGRLEGDERNLELIF